MGSAEEAMQAAAATGYPVLLKATGGGGGIGIYICHTPEEVSTNFEASVRYLAFCSHLIVRFHPSGEQGGVRAQHAAKCSREQEVS